MVTEIVPGVLDSEMLKALQEVFDYAWKELVSWPDGLSLGETLEMRRNELAAMIMLAHRSGLNPDEIVDAIRGGDSNNTDEHGPP
jgi:hypothetical protein